MPSKPVNLDEKFKFSSQKEANQYFSSILNTQPLDTRLSGLEYEAVEALLLCHPKADSKIGCGIDYLFVGSNEYGKRNFFIHRTDGTRDNFGISNCITGEPTPFMRFRSAARKAVNPDIIAFKKEYFQKNQNADGKVKCAVTGDFISMEECNVDHKVPLTFSSIARSFILAKESFGSGFALDEVEFITENVFGSQFADSNLSNEFQQFPMNKFFPVAPSFQKAL